MSVKTRKLAELLAKEAKGTNVLSKREQDDLRQLMERLDVDIAAARNTLTKVVNTTELISLTTQSEVTFSSGGTVDLGGYTLDLGANFTTTGGALQLTSSGSYTLTIAGNASVTGTNTGDDSLATNSGLVLTSHVLNMGTPQSVTSASTNNVTTSTHGHEADSTLARSAINMTAGNGLAAGSGGNLTADRTFTLGTPTTITVSTTNAVTTNSHVHTITSSASVTGETETLLATDSSGVVRLYRVGIGTAPDAQYDLDVAGSIHTSSYFVGRHAIEVKGALMLCHYDGERPWETNFTGEVTGHMGQVGNKAGGLIFRPGAFYKGAQIAEAATNLITNPSFETNTTGWSKGADITLTQSTDYSYYGTYSMKAVRAGAGIYIYANGTYVSGQVYVMSFYVRRSDGAAVTSSDITGAFIQNNSVGVASFTSVGGGWYRVISNTRTASASETSGSGFYIATGTYYFDGILLINSTYIKPYLDGSLGDGHAWTGTAHASTSTRTAATLYYANPLVAAEGTIQLHWIPSSANTTAQTSPYLFSEGNLKAYYLAADDKIYFTDGTNTISTDALTFSADLPQFLAFSWSSAGLEIKRYYNSTMDTTVTGATYTAPTLGANLYIGSDTAGANQCNGIIDDLGVIDHLYTDAEFLAIAKSDGPIFAETSTWAFRFGYNRGWSDVDGLWVIDSDSNAVFGVYGGASTKTWGGKTMATGDVLMGQAAASKAWLLFDQSEADLLFGVNTATEFLLDGGANLLKFGSDVSAAATTAIAIMGAAQTYNSESLGVGDLLIGDNTASKANVLWDKSAGTLLFRGGTTTGLTLDTTGSLLWGGGKGQLNKDGIVAAQGAVETDTTCKIRWCSSTGIDSNEYASITAYRTDMLETTTLFHIYSNDTLRLTADTRIEIYGDITTSVKIDKSSTTALFVESTAIHDNVLIADTTNGRVGVNCAPSVAFEVAGVSKITGATTIVGAETINTSSTTALLVEQDGVKNNVLVVDTTNGAVGINTAAVSGVDLSVAGIIRLTGNAYICGKSDDSGYIVVTGGHNYSNGAAMVVYGDNAGGAANEVLFTKGAFSESMRIKADGKVGINDSAPGELLDVNGNINCTGVYKVDDVQVVGPQIVDSRINDNIAETYGTSEANVLKALRAWATTWGAVVPS